MVPDISTSKAVLGCSSNWILEPFNKLGEKVLDLSQLLYSSFSLRCPSFFQAQKKGSVEVVAMQDLESGAGKKS